MSPEKMLMMLTARSSGCESMQAGFGRLTPQDIMGALQGMERGPFLAAMVLIIGDKDSFGDLRKYLWLRIHSMAKSQGWQAHRTSDKGRIDVQISNLVLIELAFGGRKCPTCGGIGHVVKEFQPVLCDTCGGRRAIRFLEKNKAEFCGMTRENWSRHWSRRYITCFNMAEGWRSTAERHIKRNLSDEFIVEAG